MPVRGLSADGRACRYRRPDDDWRADARRVLVVGGGRCVVGPGKSRHGNGKRDGHGYGSAQLRTRANRDTHRLRKIAWCFSRALRHRCHPRHPHPGRRHPRHPRRLRRRRHPRRRQSQSRRRHRHRDPSPYRSHLLLRSLRHRHRHHRRRGKRSSSTAMSTPSTGSARSSSSK